MLVAGTDPSYFGYSADGDVADRLPCPGDPVGLRPPRSIDGVSGLVRLWPSHDRRTSRHRRLVSQERVGCPRRETHWSTWGLADLGLDRTTVGPTGYRPARMLHLTATVRRVLARTSRSTSSVVQAGTSDGHPSWSNADPRLRNRPRVDPGAVGTAGVLDERSRHPGTPSVLPAPVLTAGGPYSRRRRNRGARRSSHRAPSRRRDHRPCRLHGVLRVVRPSHLRGRRPSPARPRISGGTTCRGWDRTGAAPVAATGRGHRDLRDRRPADRLPRHHRANWLLDVLAPRSGTNPAGSPGTCRCGSTTSARPHGRSALRSFSWWPHERCSTSRRVAPAGSPALPLPAIAGRLPAVRRWWSTGTPGSVESRFVPPAHRGSDGVLDPFPAGASPVTTDDDAHWVHQARVTAIPAANGSRWGASAAGAWAPNGREVSRAFCWKPEWTVAQVLEPLEGRAAQPVGPRGAHVDRHGMDGGLGGVRWCPGRAASGDYTRTLTGSGPTGAPCRDDRIRSAHRHDHRGGPVTARVAVAAPRSVVRGRDRLRHRPVGRRLDRRPAAGAHADALAAGGIRRLAPGRPRHHVGARRRRLPSAMGSPRQRSCGCASPPSRWAAVSSSRLDTGALRRTLRPATRRRLRGGGGDVGGGGDGTPDHEQVDAVGDRLLGVATRCWSPRAAPAGRTPE